MVTRNDFLIIFVITLCVFNLGFSVDVNNDIKDYVVYLGSTSDEYYVASQRHMNILKQVVEGRSAEETLIRSYTRTFSGFAAKLTNKEYEILKSRKEVLSVFPSRTLQIQTTRSWDFLGLPRPSPQQQVAESNIVVGMIDTGVWPESLSFNDQGLPPFVSQKWKGGCFGGQNFTCNNKIIGARSYTPGKTARDEGGHGSHTASTVAGRIVDNTSFFGVANGTARGGVASARIAVYKVCDATGCPDEAVLAAFDDAIADGVDLISISVGGAPSRLSQSTVAIGSFHAMQHGILTVQSAGNDGGPGSTGSVAPWLFSVSASTTDRRIADKIVLGDGTTLIGSAVNSFTLPGNQYPLVYGKTASTECDEDSAKLCLETCLDERLVKGKILVCNNSSPWGVAIQAGAVGVVGQKTQFDNVVMIYPLPAAVLINSEFDKLISYVSSTTTPTANILKSESIADKSAPSIAFFSSRGPNAVASDILKPDITAPGVDILAAFSPLVPVTEYPEDKRKVNYNVLSGTSMACPHVTGAAAYLKTLHPDWSPAAIKSSLMTTANPMSPKDDPTGTEYPYGSEFAYGSGHLNPVKAANPGLVYEATKDDYITFLCKLGDDDIGTFTGNGTAPCTAKSDQSPKDVNYPSMSAQSTPNKPITVTFTRIVTNVGVARSTYTSKVTPDSKIQVTVEPSTLSFTSLKETKSFNVTVIGTGLPEQSMATASLIWSDGIHSVRSPIVVYTSH
ncbi:hypothetical protein RND81_04G161300 [Saponaria officinalis]|uniref:Uncharacterized protein n=1 Tax=Saponaria officinalis TaxID=3572 RepID=A0AAW1LMB1_SAPOF